MIDENVKPCNSPQSIGTGQVMYQHYYVLDYQTELSNVS